MNRLMLLDLMNEVYTETPSCSWEERYTYAEMLSGTNQLTMVHISKLVCLTTTSLKRREIEVKGKPRGGRFHPEAITTLRALAKQYSLDTRVSRQLVRIANQSCSLGVIAYYTGIPETRLRNVLGE